MWWLLVQAGLADERIEAAEIDGRPAVVRVDDSAAAYTVERGPVVGSVGDWSGATVLSVGMRRWWTLSIVRQHAVAVLTQRDTPGFIERALAEVSPGTPAHTWLATAASLGGSNLDAIPDNELASQQAARFRQRSAAQPIGVYALDEVVHLAHLDAWLASPLDPEVLTAIEDQLSAESRHTLDALRQSNRSLFGTSAKPALIPRGRTDPLLRLLHPEPEPARPSLDEGSTGVPVQPQVKAEPCDRCSQLVQERPFRGVPAFDEPGVMLLPVAWSSRNRPTLEGFVGIERREVEVRYAAPPTVRGADGSPIRARWAPQRLTLLEPRPLRIELDRLPRQSDLVRRLQPERDPRAALADLAPPAPSRCGCAEVGDLPALLPLLPILWVRRRTRWRENGYRLHREDSEQRRPGR